MTVDRLAAWRLAHKLPPRRVWSRRPVRHDICEPSPKQMTPPKEMKARIVWDGPQDATIDVIREWASFRRISQADGEADAAFVTRVNAVRDQWNLPPFRDTGRRVRHERMPPLFVLMSGEVVVAPGGGE